MKNILHRPEVSGRIAKWTIELSEFDIQFRPRASIKAQALADFLVECTIPDEVEEEKEEESPTIQASDPPSDPDNEWRLFVDGSSNSNGSGAGLLLISPEGVTTEYALRFNFQTTNNAAEYEALAAGLRIAKAVGAEDLKAFSDSQLVVGQVTGSCAAKEDGMVKYLQRIKEAVSAFKSFDIQRIPRMENSRADLLSKLVTSSPSGLPKTVYFEIVSAPLIEDKEDIMQIDEEPSWIDPLLAFLKDGFLPADRKEARKIRHQATNYILHEGLLYKRSYSLPLLKCLRPAEADYAMREVHEGICGAHIGKKALSYKLLRQGYYWPTMQKDSEAYVKQCDKCQRNSDIQRLPAVPITPICSPWPFAQWGMDILGPFPMATGQRKFLLVAIDYFTKWVEAEALAKITEARVIDFVWRSIICRFGQPNVLITDNGRQFTGAKFEEFCDDYRISHHLTSVAHPQANGEAEVTNRTLLQGIKRRLDKAKGSWADELHHVLWAYRTTPRVPTGETPFSLSFGTEAVIPVERGLPSARIENYNEDSNSERRRADLDLLEEAREAARIRMATYKQKMVRYYNSKVRPKIFRAGDLVLRRAEVSQPGDRGKLAPNWEGPYKVIEVVKPGTYRLERLDGTALQRPWNSENLRVYYQ